MENERTWTCNGCGNIMCTITDVPPERCSSCGSDDIEFHGYGTLEMRKD